MRRRAALILVLAGCHGQIGDTVDPAELEALPREVEDPLPSLPTTLRCVDLPPQSAVLGVSPEGHLWTSRSSTITPDRMGLRVDPASPDESPHGFELGFARLDAFVAHDADRASALAEGRPWLIRAGGRVTVTAPFEVAAGAQLCGDLGEDGFIFQRADALQRDGDAWVRWDGLGAIGGTTTPLSRNGACWSGPDRVLLRSESDVYALEPSSSRRIGRFSGPIASLNGEILAVNEGWLFHGETRYELEAGLPLSIASEGGRAWLRTADRLLSFDGTQFSEIESPPEGELHAFAAGGAWVVGTQACLLDPGRVEVQGLPSGGRTDEGRLELRVRGPAPEMGVRLAVDGRIADPLALEDDWYRFDVELEVGWAEVNVVTTGADEQRYARTLLLGRRPAERRSWEVDVKPIYGAHCSSGGCHVSDSPSGAPDLAEFEQWVERAEAIERRVLELKDMPPPAARSLEWGEIEETVIREWLGGGLRP